MEHRERELGAATIAADEGHAPEGRVRKIRVAEIDVIEGGVGEDQSLERSLLAPGEESLRRVLSLVFSAKTRDRSSHGAHFGPETAKNMPTAFGGV
jgi:hypothetical protein